MYSKLSQNPFYGRPSPRKQKIRELVARNYQESFKILREIRAKIAPTLAAINAADLQTQRIE